MIDIIRNFLLWTAVILATGCASKQMMPPEQHELTVPEEILFNQAINVYSSYISEEVEQTCTQAALSNIPCKNDGIPANEFLTGLEKLNLFTELSPSVSRHDYELLIANQVADMPAASNQAPSDLPIQSYTEFSVEWRGVHLDSFLVHYRHDSKVTTDDIAQIILRWSEHARQLNLFSTPFLYQAMGASDYTAALTLPELLG